MVDVIYLDFAKAFDVVDHGVLLRKLRSLGVAGGVLRWMTSFLKERKQSVAVEGCISSPSMVRSGVPQGTVLGPILFLVHIMNIDEDVVHASVSSFADDTRVTMKIGKEEDVLNLQADLSTIYQWANRANMKFNSLKFEHLHYGKPAPYCTYYDSGGQQIEEKSSVRDLGILVSNSGKYKDHINSMVQKARQTMGWILRSFKTRNPTFMLTLFKAMVIPVLEYCCQLWSPSRVGLIRKIEGVQRTLTYRITRASDNYWERLRQFGIYSLERRRERYQIIYVWKTINDIVPNLSGNSKI